MVVIVDYQAGNIGSIRNMLTKIGVSSVISADANEVAKATHLILPGVGAFDYGMQKLNDLGLLPVLREKAWVEKVPVLGICLGAQLMCKSSEEGKLPGLGWIDGEVKKFPGVVEGKRYPVPHMGWDYVKKMKDSALAQHLPDPSRFYFVHSYFIALNNPSDILFTNQYSVSYVSAFEHANIMGVQFHPEKSHNFGKKLLKNFIEKNL